MKADEAQARWGGCSRAAFGVGLQELAPKGDKKRHHRGVSSRNETERVDTPRPFFTNLRNVLGERP